MVWSGITFPKKPTSFEGTARISQVSFHEGHFLVKKQKALLLVMVDFGNKLMEWIQIQASYSLAVLVGNCWHMKVSQYPRAAEMNHAEMTQ